MQFSSGWSRGEETKKVVYEVSAEQLIIWKFSINIALATVSKSWNLRRMLGIIGSGTDDAQFYCLLLSPFSAFLFAW